MRRANDVAELGFTAGYMFTKDLIERDATIALLAAALPKIA